MSHPLSLMAICFGDFKLKAINSDYQLFLHLHGAQIQISLS